MPEKNITTCYNIAMNGCIFCKILNKEIPAHIVYEDEHVLAFLDIHPHTHGHTLVIPKDHFENIISTPDETMCRLIIATRKLAVEIQGALDVNGVVILMDGQHVPHTHIHIIPRPLDKDIDFTVHLDYAPGEAEAIAEKIKTVLTI